MALQPVSEKYMFYENQGRHVGIDGNQLLLEGNPLWFWNDKLILMEHGSDDKFWRFTALDLITSETRSVHFSKSQSKFRRVQITPLANDYGFIVESLVNDCCVNLVKLKWAPGEFKAIEQFEQAGRQFSGIIVNSLSPSKFVLRQLNNGRFIYQACKLDSGRIEFVGTYNSSFFEHYFDEKLFSVVGNQIITYDWKTNDQKEIEGNLDDKIDRWRTCWIKDRLYLATRFGDDENDTRKHGIAYTDLETRRWASIDFVIDMRISRIQYFDGNLIVYTNNADGNNFDSAMHDSTYSDEFKVYSIPVKQPQKLRRMAWLLVLQELKRDENITDPYHAAAKFLPFNSDLRPSWYKEEAALEVFQDETNNGQNQDVAAGNNARSSQDSVNDPAPKRQKFN